MQPAFLPFKRTETHTLTSPFLTGIEGILTTIEDVAIHEEWWKRHLYIEIYRRVDDGFAAEICLGPTRPIWQEDDEE